MYAHRRNIWATTSQLGSVEDVGEFGLTVADLGVEEHGLRGFEFSKDDAAGAVGAKAERAV